MSDTPKDKPISEQTDDILKLPGDWRGEVLSELRGIITHADPMVIEEVKWKKPSKPMGVPVWSRDGILCVADTLKNAVRLTFPKGAQLKDARRLFNTRLDSRTVRAVDFYKDNEVDEDAVKTVILEAMELNASKLRK
jgi:hypothetical protein